MNRSAFTFVLHSHLPWVLHHGRWPHGVDWLNEATAETYLPLWRVLHEREHRGPLGVTLGLTPVLCEQLAHPDFPAEFIAYLQQKIAAAAEDRSTCSRTGETRIATLASRWEQIYRELLEDFCGPHGTNLVARFRRLEERGAIEIITCGVTHGYLPLLSRDAAVTAQVRNAVVAHRRHFGRAPRGIWLPECAYRPAGPWASPLDPGAPARPRPGIEETLARHGLEYFFVDRHLLSGGKALGVYADRFDVLRHVTGDGAPEGTPAEHPPYRAYGVGPSGPVSCFGRDAVTAVQVWSGEHGYPGDGAYLDFHKKRFPGGHRYWAVTHPRADLAHKEIYRPEQADARIGEHAAHFIELLRRVLDAASQGRSDASIVTAMYDTELFGHWWYEGPRFLAAVLDGLDVAGIAPVTAGAFLAEHPPRERVSLPEGSWGDGGGHQVWLNDLTRWTWEPIYACEARMERIARAAQGTTDPLAERLVRQLARELLLLEASDWQFLITTLSARDYAEHRFTGHVETFERLARMAEQRLAAGSVTDADERYLSESEARDGLLADVDWQAYASGEALAGVGG
jgi:1,4-alpha-glucan branching enzyme